MVVLYIYIYIYIYILYIYIYIYMISYIVLYNNSNNNSIIVYIQQLYKIVLNYILVCLLIADIGLFVKQKSAGLGPERMRTRVSSRTGFICTIYGVFLVSRSSSD